MMIFCFEEEDDLIEENDFSYTMMLDWLSCDLVCRKVVCNEEIKDYLFMRRLVC